MIFYYGKKMFGELCNILLCDSLIYEDCDVLKFKNILNLVMFYWFKIVNVEIFRIEIRINVFKGW